MSATNRGGVRSLADFYRSPAWAVHRFLEAVELPGNQWLELGAGEGDIIRAADEVVTPGWWTAVELREECRPMLETSGAHSLVFADVRSLLPEQLGVKGADRFDVSIGNPPFCYAMEFILKSLQLAHWTALLLRLNFLASDERAAFMRQHTPDIYVIPDRISFTGDGGTDSAEHAWFVWPPHHRRRRGRIKVLGTTPLAVRKAQMLPPSLVGVDAWEQQELFA